MLSYSWVWIPAIFIVGTAVLAIPYLAFLVFVLLLLVPLLLIWGGEFLAHDPAEEIRDQFLGRGGPDDPFAGDPYDE
jgi:predicted DNA repair protein MutK